MKFIVLLVGMASCDVFDNKEFEKVLEDSPGETAKPNEADKDMLIGTAELKEGEKPPGGGEKPADPKAGGKPGGDPKAAGGKQGDTKAGGKSGDSKGGSNPKISTIKVQDKDAVMIEGDGKDAPSVVVVSDQSAMKSEEELMKLANDIKGSVGKEGGAGKQGGDQKQGGAGKPQGGDQKQGGAGKPPGGDQKQGGAGKPPGGDQKQGGAGAAKQKLQEGNESLSLLSFETSAGTEEGEKAQESLNNLIKESKKPDTKYPKSPFWTTVLVDNNPRKVLVNIKTITVLESISDKKEGKDKGKKETKTDKEVSTNIGSIKPKDDKPKEKDKKEKEKEDKSKEKEKEKEKEAKEKEKDKKEVKDKKEKEEKDKKEEKAKEKEKDKEKENDKKEDKSKKKEKEKEDKSKEKEKEKKEKETKSKDTFPGSNPQQKEDRPKDRSKKTEKDNIKYETPDIKEGESQKEDKSDGIFGGIFGTKKETTSKQENNKRLNTGDSTTEVKIDSKATTSKVPYITKLNSTTTKVVQKPSTDKKKEDKNTESTVKIEKSKEKESKDGKSKESKEKEDKSKESKESKEKEVKPKETKDTSKDPKNNKNPVEEVIFMGGKIPSKAASTKKDTPPKDKDKEASMDDLLFVLKNMPKAKGKGGKELYVEGDFETPKEDKLEKKKYKFVGVIKANNK